MLVIDLDVHLREAVACMVNRSTLLILVILRAFLYIRGVEQTPLGVELPEGSREKEKKSLDL